MSTTDQTTRAVNPDQARQLLNAVATVQPSGPGLVVFFAAMYDAALRPAEAATLRKSNLALPPEGWGGAGVGIVDPDGRRRLDRQWAAS